MKPPKRKRPKRKVSREIAKSRRITGRASRRWHKQDGKKASKRESLLADLLVPALSNAMLGLAVTLLGPYMPEPKKPKKPTAPKSHQIGKENPRDVVIDVKPERIE